MVFPRAAGELPSAGRTEKDGVLGVPKAAELSVMACRASSFSTAVFDVYTSLTGRVLLAREFDELVPVRTAMAGGDGARGGNVFGTTGTIGASEFALIES